MVAGRTTQPLNGDVLRPDAAYRLCRVADLADRRSRGFDPLGEGRDTLFVVRDGDAVFGYRNACPHYDFARMAWRKDEYLNGDRTFIRCGAHGALFRIADGECVEGPCLGDRLTAVPIVVTDGWIRIAGPFAPGTRPRAGAAARRTASPPE